ncbi:hypothetical protein SRB17_12730 [Streptomyces sp. RB17]|uniref:hypothetical protein n=1 Tax=Streptomyces sp. RB17 TaxID=2585197 RepID=UPI00130AE65B|nr:hypothetical protein [Streptomyces sp. RB17]MQY33312.1 hypothetical protein [Streptomyces sp. RB17]
MKLGKALATGVVEERPVVREEEAEGLVAEEAAACVASVEPDEPVREEVPAVR